MEHALSLRSARTEDMAYFEMDNNGDQSKEIEMARECHQNIYNAFLILNHRQEVEIKDNPVFNREIRIGLGALAYITAITQWTAMMFLTRIVMLDSQDTINDYFDSYTLLPANARSLMTLPFFIIGVIAMFKEGSESVLDLVILEQSWDIKSPLSFNGKCKCNTSWREWQVFFFKVMTEQLLGYAGSAVYFIVITAYSHGNESWNDVLNTILNLLAYTFILDTDEYAYNMMETIIQTDLAQTLPNFEFDDLFQGFVYKQRGKKITGKIQFRVLMIFFITGMMQSSYSRSWVLLGITLVLSIVGSVWITFCGTKRLFQTIVVALPQN